MNSWSHPSLIDLPTYIDELGSLGVIEKDFPFPYEMKRIYFLHGITKEAVRGSHAHKELHQLIIAVNGSFTVTLDDGKSTTDFDLCSPSIGLTVPPGYWRTLSKFTSGSVALVIASLEYDENDYIRNYDDFLEWAK